uniref:Uncharacterized protein n=2 Tax=Caenorhabditis japonica TaxID=281687 RepID=A0A8R1EBR2_CAEJA
MNGQKFDTNTISALLAATFDYYLRAIATSFERHRRDNHASSEGSRENSTWLIFDMFQAQLALWTCAFSLLYLYAWMQHRKKFLLSIFIVVPITFTLTCAMSGLLAVIVIIGRVFSTPVDYKHYFDLSRHGVLDFDREFIREAFHQRSMSGGSTSSLQDDSMLPKPLCKRHSSLTYVKRNSGY